MASNRVVSVTGASGYIASELVRQLLAGGYHVQASVRDVSNAKKTEHLRKLDNAGTHLTLKQANLLQKGSFKDTIKGTECVFHTASPFFLKSDNPEEELIAPAVEGTKNVLESCAEEPSVKRVVLTSSTAAVTVADKDPSHVFSEKDFSDPNYMRGKGLNYPLSKTLAEQAAWDFMEKEKPHFDLIVTNPCAVMGPMLQPSLNTSSEWILQYLDGSKEEISDSYVSVVDVRDVAKAHVRAFENENSQGRYMLSPFSEHWSTMVDILKELDIPDHSRSKLPTKVQKSDNPGHRRLTDNSKAEEELGMEWTPVRQSLKDHVATLKSHGYL